MNIRTTIITLCLLLTGAAAHASPSAEEVIDGVNKGLYPGYRAVATGDTLILEGRGNRKTIPMPEDRFYLAAAPYISGTHP